MTQYGLYHRPVEAKRFKCLNKSKADIEVLRRVWNPEFRNRVYAGLWEIRKVRVPR